MGLSPQYGNRFKTETEINREFYEINRKLESFTFEVVNSTPTIGTMEKGQVKIFSLGAKNLFFRVENELYYVSGTRWQ